MSNYRSTRYARLKQLRRKRVINAYYRHKAAAELIPDNDNAFRPKIQADAVVIIRLKGQGQMQFSSYKTTFGWTISPTLAGKKVQQVMMRA